MGARKSRLHAFVDLLIAVNVLVLLSLAVFAGILSHRYGSVAYGISRLKGVALVARFQRDVAVEDSEDIIKPIEFQNLTDQPIRLVGVEKHCSCTVVKNAFPFDIPARQTRSFRLTLKGGPIASGQPSHITFYTDHPAQSRIAVQFHVVRKPSS